MPGKTFTLDILRWQPWLPPVQLDSADELQIKALTAAGAITRDSPYFRTLAHAPEALAARMTLYNDIVYGREGLSRPEREFSMFSVSLINECVYCASIHGRRFVELSKNESPINALLHASHPDHLPRRLHSIYEFAEKVTSSPQALSRADVEPLRKNRLTDAEILDLIQATAMFAWANTLMLTLGQPEPAGGEKNDR